LAFDFVLLFIIEETLCHLLELLPSLIYVLWTLLILEESWSPCFEALLIDLIYYYVDLVLGSWIYHLTF